MDAYRGAILNNPSLMNNATVMDVGCGTGILRLVLLVHLYPRVMSCCECNYFLSEIDPVYEPSS